MTSPDHPDPVPDGLEQQLAASVTGGSAACPDLLDLASYLDGRAGRATSQAIEDHLAGCTECLQAVRATRAVAGEDAGSIDVPAAVLDAARSLVRDAPARVETESRWRLVLPDWRAAARWSVAAAAMLAICLLGYQAGLSSLPAPEPAAAGAPEALTEGVFDAALNDDVTRDVFIVALSEKVQ